MTGSIWSAAVGVARRIGGLTLAAGLAVALAASWSGAALAQASGTRTSSFDYDPNTGLLTQEVIEPDTPAMRLQTDYTYNVFGQKVAATVSGVDIATRTASTAYDAKGQFPTSAANALSQTESWEYDPRFGSPTKHTGPNGLTTTWEYDGFGRKTKELRADGTHTLWSYLYCSGTAGGTASCPAGATQLVEVKALGADGATKLGPTSTKYFDQLDRVIIEDAEGFDGSLTRAEVRYDALGRVEKKSRPYFVSGGTPKWTLYTYDALGRVIATTAPNSAVTTATYNGLTTKTTNAAGQTTSSTKNSQGKVVEVKDADNHTTTYEYESFGNLTKVTDAVGNVTTYVYDARGRKVTVNDPDSGTYTYTYDVLDKVKTSTNAASEVTTLTYDLLGRLTQRVEPGMTSTWTWDTATKGVGKIATAATSGGYLRTHIYDALGRPEKIETKIGSETHTTAAEYDAASRVAKVSYPSGFAVKYSYNAFGYQDKLANAATGVTLWQADARDAELHLTKQTAGNGVVTLQEFDPNTGQLTKTLAGGGAVQDQSYTYDSLGKLTSRSDANTALAESFEYDNLNRLTKSIVSLTPSPLVSTFSYNAIGNLTFKSDVGAYNYPAPGQARPHGVTSVSGGTINASFTYDAKGNLVAGNGLSIAYTSYNKTASITRGTTTISFEHDPEHQRYAQSSPSGVTLYLSGMGVLAERFGQLGGPQRWTNYIMAGGRLVGIHVENADETTLTRYFHTDHLGSIAVITNEAGQVAQRLSYDAWGLRRHPDGTPDPSGAIQSESTRGFTGHEHLAEVGLIHMNGRVYDPLLARFGTPDPMTEDPYSTQGWNRYSYVGNSPLNFTDPSGYCFMGCFWKPAFKAIGNFFRQNWGAILQIAATAMCGGNPLCGAVVAGVTSAVVVGVSGGSLGEALRAGFISAATVAAMWGVGELTSGFSGTLTSAGGHGPLASGSEAHLFNIGGHALVGCASSVARGSNCGSGALAGAIGPTVAPALRGQSHQFRVVANSVMGGLASVAGGGTFANGATTAAFGYLFNAAARCGQGRCTLLGFLAGSAAGAYFAAGAEAATLGVQTPLVPAEVALGAFAGTIIGGILDVLGWEPPNWLAASRPGDFTQGQKDAILGENAANGGGTIHCENCGLVLEPIPNVRGVRTPDNQINIHHDPAIEDGGGRDSTGVVLCRPCHQEAHK